MLVMLMSDRKVCNPTSCVHVVSFVRLTTLHPECVVCQQMCICCPILFDEASKLPEEGRTGSQLS